MNKLNPIKYIENMISHHPKSISLWITEGIVINGERYIIKEFRLRDGSLYAVIAENKYTPKYFEVKLAPDEETLKDIYKAIEENKLAIEKEVTDRKNEIARVDTAIKANTTKIEQEIADRKSEIARVDKAIAANTAKIDKEIADRESEIERVDQAIEANTEKINQEITDRQNEITRVDNAINANTAKIDKEIQDRKNEITRVDGAIHANTEKINQEITDRTNEINRVDGKLTDLEGKLTTSDGKIAELDKATKDNKAKIDQEIIDRKREIDRVDEATKANKATIDQEIANRRDEINRVDQAVAANTAKINKEISDRQNEISRVDGAINANTAKINKEIQDRKGEITRVEGSISANTAKIDKEITDRKSEIACVEGKIPTSIGVRNLWIQSKATGSFTEETLPDNHITGQKKCYRITNNNELSFSIEPNFSPRLYRKVTLSAWVKYENVVQGTNNWNVFNCFKHSLYYKNSSTGATTNADYLTLEGFTGTSDWKYITYTHDYSENKSYDQLKTSIRFNLENARSGTAWVTGIKIELGSIPSDYTPSSEDVESLIAQKQDKLTAGKGIAIQGNVISATVDSTPQHDTQKEQVLASTRSTITITHGANGTSETTKVDTNPAKVLEHDNLLTDNGISKTTSGNTTKLGLEYRRVDGGRFDLNKLVNGKVRASDFVNAPSTGWLFVSSYDEGSYAIQRAVKLVDNNNISYVRRKDAGSWGAWREQAGDKSVIDSAISANTTKINQEITDRKNEITRVEGKIPTSVSTRNLILKSNDFANPHKATGNNTTVTSTDDYFVIRSTGYTSNGWGGMSWNMSISEVKAGEEFSVLMPVYIDSSVNLDNGWSFNIKNHTLNSVAYDYSIPTNKKDQWFNVAITFKTYKDVVFDTYPFYVYLVKNGLVRIKPPMLVRGNIIPRDYQPAFEDNIMTSVDTVNLIKDTGSSFIMGYGITNTTWNETKKQTILDFSAPDVRRDISAEILPQQNKFFDFKPIKGMTYTQSIMIDTDATFNPNGQAQCSWFTSSGHNKQKAYIKKVGEHSYQVWSTYTWNLENTALRAFDWYNLHDILLFRTTGTYLAFYKPKLTTGNLPSDWSPAPEDYDSKLVSVKSEIKQTTDTISARVTSLDSSTVKNSSLTINADGTVMKAGKTTTDIANAIGSYFAVNQNAVNKFSDRINVKTAMIADGAVTSAKIAREITLDMLTCGKIKNTNEITVFDLNTGTLKFNNNSGRIQRTYRDKVIEITDYITSTSGAQDYATSAFVVRKSDNSKQAAVKLTLDNTKAESTITSDLFYISDSKSKMLFSVDRTNNVKPDWGDIPIAHVLGGLVANDISIGGRSKSLLKIVDELCKKSGITWS